jgi:hypothetical protein
MLLTEAVTIIKTKPTAQTNMNTMNKTPTSDQTDHVNVARAGVKEKWACKSCGIAVTLFVAVTHPPTHICSKKANRTITLKQEGDTQ